MQARRSRAARLLNAAILAAQSREEEASLPMLLRRLSLLTEEMREHAECRAAEGV